MQINKTKLKSGLPLITIPIKGIKTVTVLVAVAAGSNYETKDINGISHFLEHMMFKGTKKRPNTLAIAEELDSIGGDYNAFTSKEYTGYWAKAQTDNLELLLDIISDIFLNSKFQTAEIQREKGVILEEMNMYKDTPIHYICDLLEELMYAPAPQGWKIIGEPKTVKAINQQKLKQYFSDYYNAYNTVVIVAGNINQAQVKKQTNKYFAKIAQTGLKTAKIKTKIVQNQPKLLVHYKKTDQTHLCCGLHAVDINSKDLPALKLLNIILGGNMSSRLFIKIRERKGLCYYINSYVEAYKSCGYLGIRAGVQNKCFQKALQLILKELACLFLKGVTKAELQRAKDYAKGKLALSLESSSDVAFWAAIQKMKKGKVKTPTEILTQIQAISVKQVNKLAKRIFQDKKLNVAIIGPYKKPDKFKKILSIKDNLKT